MSATTAARRKERYGCVANFTADEEPKIQAIEAEEELAPTAMERR